MSSATAKIILDTRRMKKTTGKYPVKLLVIYQSAPERYQTTFELSKEDFAKISAPHINEKLQTIRDKLRTIQTSAKAFIDNNLPFTFYEFERDFVNANDFLKPRKLKEPEYLSDIDNIDFSSYHKRFKIFNENHSKPGTISIVFLSYIKKLLLEERLGSAMNYQETYNSIKKFRGNVLFTDITVSFLVQYEQWMKNKNCVKSTIGIKLRPLRAIFNEAIETGIIKREKCYPFGKRKYIIPSGRNIKKALSADQISSIYYYEPACPNERKAKDFWMFCYLANGINPKDVAFLKNKNIEGEYLIFIRAKTEHTTRDDPKPITVYITEDLKNILDRRRSCDRHPDSYLFPILEPDLHPIEQHNNIKWFIKYINKGMKKIGLHLGIDKKVTSIVSRHSFSTQLKRSGVSTEFIQEALGHTDKRTTENYLDSFTKDIKKEYASFLTTFNNPK